jgi:hypothetical protein
MDVDDETLQIQADVQLARESLRAREARKMRERAAANNDDNDDIDDSRTGEAAEARDVPHNNPGSKTEIGRRWGLGGVSAEDYERIKARIEKRREPQQQTTTIMMTQMTAAQARQQKPATFRFAGGLLLCGKV